MIEFAALVVSTSLLAFSEPPPAADGEALGAAADNGDAQDGAAGAHDSAEDPDAEELTNDDIANMPGFASLSPEGKEALLAADDARLDAVMKKFDSGEPLDTGEQLLADAVLHVALAEFEQTLSYQTGDIPISNGLATLHLGSAYRYLDPAGTERVLVEAWGNPPGSQTLGMIVPAAISPIDPQRGWGVLVSYTEEGHVEDDDAEDIDYDELLEQMQEATEAENPSREAQGYPAMHLVGWAEPPHYDGARHSLYWAQELSGAGAPENSLNYAIRVLGRKGVLELNAVSNMSQMAAIKPEMEKIYGLVEFDSGNRYIDFDPDLDDVAAYGIGGLIAGKVAMKVGLWAVILKFLIAGKKFLIVIGIAIAAGARALIGRKKKNS